MVDSEENEKFDLGVKGLKMTKIDKNHYFVIIDNLMHTDLLKKYY